MAGTSTKNEAKEEFYDDLKLPPISLCVSEVCDGYNHATDRPPCCASSHTDELSDEEEWKKKLYECNHCGLRFRLSIALKYHVKGFHGDDHFFQCSDCKFSSHVLSQIRRHLREAHSAEKRYPCTHCSYAAKRSTHLKRHIEARHSPGSRPRRIFKSEPEDGGNKDIEDDDEKPLLCSICGYSTYIERNLKRHIRAIHEQNVNLHKCTTCEFSSSTLRELRHHIKADHENAKVFTCPICDYKTVHIGSLRNHISARHTDERVHKCPHCPYRAVQNGNLKRHVKQKHPGKRMKRIKSKK